MRRCSIKCEWCVALISITQFYIWEQHRLLQSVHSVHLFFLEWMWRDDVQKTVCASIPDNLWKCVPYLSDALGMILVDRTTQGDREGWQMSAPTRDSKTPRYRVHSQLQTRLQTLSKMCLYGSQMITKVNSNLYFSFLSSCSLCIFMKCRELPRFFNVLYGHNIQATNYLIG